MVGHRVVYVFSVHGSLWSLGVVGRLVIVTVGLLFLVLLLPLLLCLLRLRVANHIQRRRLSQL